MLFYFDFRTYGRMVALARTENDPRTRRRLLLVLLLWVPLAAGFHAVCFFLDGILFPGLWRVRVQEPVFLVGHARSGTTLLHRLMSRDQGRFSSFRLYELYFPSLLQKKLIRLGARIDRALLGGVLERRVRAWEERRYGALRGIHEMGLTKPEEDDLVLYYSCASGFWITKLPYMGELDFYHIDRRPPRARRRLMRFYRECVRRQLYLNGAEKTHLSKNPVFAGRVESLIEAFPDARFVVTMRNPYETIPSLLSLLRGAWRARRWAPERVERCLGVLAEQSFETYRDPLDALARHPEIRCAIVDYRKLKADSAAAVERVYTELGIAMTLAFREALGAERRRSASHVSRHSYSLDDFGLERGEIRRRLADLFERFGWEGPPAAEAATGESRAR